MTEQQQFAIDDLSSSSQASLLATLAIIETVDEEPAVVKFTLRAVEGGRLRRLVVQIAKGFACGLLLAAMVLGASAPVSAQVAIGVSVTVAPPPLPIYEQPLCPGPG